MEERALESNELGFIRVDLAVAKAPLELQKLQKRISELAAHVSRVPDEQRCDAWTVLGRIS